ncbi:MFS transporter [Paraburkholderia sp. J76]|uniref:MFS transporter n=1 Tax=Paraburkholderia sp. J76 TaxID=2805439 RepID=UPI002ABD1895|nr:MFS transporter [Paraburkholderia sp. J76]
MTSASHYRPRQAWSVAVLLAALATINFLDKVVLGMVATPLMAEFGLSPAAFGMVAGSFFWLFSVSNVIGGLLADRLPTRWLLLGMAAIWSLLQWPLAASGSVVTLVVCRVVLGAAEGPSFPVSVHALFKWFPDDKRSLPIAIINQGAALGVILAGLLMPLVTHHWGWRVNFMVLGAIGVAWCVLWLRFGQEGTLADRAARETAARVPYRTILRQPAILLVFLLSFAAYWTLGLILTWLPSYLQTGLGYDSVSAGRIFALVVLFSAPVTIGVSWFSGRLLARGTSTRVARVQIVNGCFVLSAALFLALATLSLTPLQKVVVFALASALPMCCFALVVPVVATLVPSAQRASIIAIMTALASVAGAIAPPVTGRVLQAYGAANARSYETAFLIGAALMVIAALLAACYLHPDRQRHDTPATLTPESP